MDACAENDPARSRALAAYAEFADARAEPIRGGLINQSYVVVTDRGEFILQRVNPVFSLGIHCNIAAVTTHLARKNLTTPRLLPTREDANHVDLGSDGIWRAMNRIPGTSHDCMTSKRQASEAGGLVARFHEALFDLEHAFQPLGFTLHDPSHHFEALQKALKANSEHRLCSTVSSLASSILDAASSWEPLGELPMRATHGDLKFNNLLFANGDDPEQTKAICLIDLDTLSRLPLFMELGDAWRSWCNPSGEDTEQAEFDMGLFEASAEGYLQGLSQTLERNELRSLAFGVERISLELAARFAADALNEAYFGWDANRFGSAGEHNLTRARGQWSLYQDAVSSREARLRILLR